MSKPSTPEKYINPEDAFKEQLLFNLVYCSQISAGVENTDVDTIIATSRRRNSASGITGILVFGDGVFFQWIEGPKAEVTALVKLIETDRRHELMVILSEDEEIRERIFPTWDMELVDAENIQEVLQDALDTAQDQKSVDALELMLEKLQERN
ncbi:BLUF domain-containing protein [Luminiphilus sp.]|nr:BLUF domain-containing protein [Luminiphilus sp.]MDA7840140.1 BLUF domain-containing protein [Luminiphilus sp.]